MNEFLRGLATVLGLVTLGVIVYKVEEAEDLRLTSDLNRAMRRNDAVGVRRVMREEVRRNRRRW